MSVSNHCSRSNARAAPCPAPEDRVSAYNAFETPRSKAAIDLRPCQAFCGPTRSRAFRSELRMISLLPES